MAAKFAASYLICLYKVLSMADRIVPLMLLLADACGTAYARAQGWFFFSLLSNAGLNSSTVTSADACISSCVSSGTCSAISYEQSTSTCVYSYCANLYLVKNTGWNTCILNSIAVEKSDYPTPQIEWMMSDTCGLASTGSFSDIPSIILANGTYYKPSPSKYQGNAPYTPNAATPSIYSGNSSSLNCSFALSSFTLSVWINLENTSSGFMMFAFEFLQNAVTIVPGNEFFLDNANLSVSLLGPEQQVWSPGYDFPKLTWTQYTAVYDPVGPLVKIYVNSTLFHVSRVSLITSAAPCSTVFFGGRVGGWATFVGQYFCAKMFNSALNVTQIQALAISCLDGRIRLDGSPWKFR